MMRFNRQTLLEGYVLHVHHLKGSLFSRLIQWYLGDGSHDALIVRDPTSTLLAGDGGLGIGELVMPRGRLTPLPNYECAIERGEIRVQVLRPKGYDHYSGICASNYFRTHEVGRRYNWAAYALLPLKIIGDWVHWPWDLAWDWCTESVMWSWLKGAGGEGNVLKPPGLRDFDYWRKAGDHTTWLLRPTPLTTQHRLEEGVFEDVTAQCLVEDGRAARSQPGRGCR